MWGPVVCPTTSPHTNLNLRRLLILPSQLLHCLHQGEVALLEQGHRLQVRQRSGQIRISKASRLYWYAHHSSSVSIQNAPSQYSHASAVSGGGRWRCRRSTGGRWRWDLGRYGSFMPSKNSLHAGGTGDQDAINCHLFLPHAHSTI